jgi:hypothetical protein
MSNKTYKVIMKASWSGQRLNVECEVNYEKLCQDILFAHEDAGRFPLEREPEHVDIHICFSNKQLKQRLSGDIKQRANISASAVLFSFILNRMLHRVNYRN